MNSKPYPERKTERLHLGRISTPGARYFVTFVTAERKSWLRTPGHTQTVLEALRIWHDEKDGRILAATIMPDHVHVLLELGSRLTVGRCVARWKSEVRSAMRYTEEWLRDFWEHRVRDDESWEDYGLYIFLNSYRVGLIRRDEVWPWWWAPEPTVFLFTAALDPRGVPPAEWIDWPEERFAKLDVGE